MSRAMRTLLLAGAALLVPGIPTGPALPAQAQEAPVRVPTSIVAVPAGNPFLKATVSRLNTGQGVSLTITDPVARAEQVVVTLTAEGWDPADRRVRVTLRGRNATAEGETRDGDAWKASGAATVTVPAPGTLEIPLDGTPKADARLWFALTESGKPDAVQHRSPIIAMAHLEGTGVPEMRGQATAWATDGAGVTTGPAATGRAAILRVKKNQFVLVVPDPPADVESRPVSKVVDAVLVQPPGAGPAFRLEADSRTRKVRVINNTSGVALPNGAPFELDFTPQQTGINSAVLAFDKLAKIINEPINKDASVTVVRTVDLADGGRLFTQTGTLAVASIAPAADGTPGTTVAKAGSSQTGSSGISAKRALAVVGGLVLLALVGVGVGALRRQREAERQRNSRPRPGAGSTGTSDPDDLTPGADEE